MSRFIISSPMSYKTFNFLKIVIDLTTLRDSIGIINSNGSKLSKFEFGLKGYKTKIEAISYSEINNVSQCKLLISQIYFTDID